MFLRFSATTRIALSLVGLTTSFLLLASAFGIFPDRKAQILAGRAQLCEALAVNFSVMAKHADLDTILKSFTVIAERNPQVASLAIKQANGEYLFSIGPHLQTWTLKAEEGSTESQMVVPVYSKKELWGTLQVAFLPIEASGITGVLQRPDVRLAAYMCLVTLVSFTFYLRKVLKQLNPSKVIPGRVREAFDSLAEGLVVMDRNERVVLANRAFQNATDRSFKALLGRKISDIPFTVVNDDHQGKMPWQLAIQSTRPIRGYLLRLVSGEEPYRIFSTSAAPICDEAGKNRGAIVSFEDVTTLEEKKMELQVMVEHLHKSTEKIKQQNQELEILATRDALTGCFNRRSFLERFDTAWKTSHRYGFPLSAIMVDVDHFKSVNDTYGHSMGDEVLRGVSATLLSSSRDTDIVCRFGGEEFAILLPNTDIEGAETVAEKLRIAISQMQFDDLSVTASLGVSAISENPQDPQELLDQADKCLYVAKRNGRNQVVRWDQVPKDLTIDESQVSRTKSVQLEVAEPSIPFHSVAALLSALAFRDQHTAAHSRRVADLCVALAEGILSLRDCYTLEIAALLHDIGKLGVPDAILLKPGALTDDEWEVMRRHERISVEILRASFNSPALTSIIEHHSFHFGGDALRPGQPVGRDIPIGSRILAIADAYDAMTSHQVYRTARAHHEAVEELLRCQGTQFDPELVARFIRMMDARRFTSDFSNFALSPVSTEAALGIGLQIERLIEALDDQDIRGMGSLSQRLSATATKYGAHGVAMAASELEQAIKDKGDLLDILHAANQLLDECRASQISLVNNPLQT